MSKASTRAHAKMAAKRGPGRRPAGGAALALTADDLRALDTAIRAVGDVSCPQCGTSVDLAKVRELLIRLQSKMGQGATLWFGNERR